MSAKQFYHDIDLVGISQLVNARLQNVTNAQMTALAATLTAANTGLVVFNTDQNQQFNWSGSKFDPVAVDLAGDVIFRGVVDATKPLTGQVDNVSGYQYVVGVAGTIPSSLTLAGGAVTVFGDTNLDGVVSVESGDVLLFAGSNGADVDKTQSGRADSLYVIQRNSEQATEAALGSVRLATQNDVNLGADMVKAITPATLAGAVVANRYTRQYFGTVNIAANTPFTVMHNLSLTDRDAFQINTMLGNSQISLDIDSVDANSLTLTSVVPLTGVKVTIAGASTVFYAG